MTETAHPAQAEPAQAEPATPEVPPQWAHIDPTEIRDWLVSADPRVSDVMWQVTDVLITRARDEHRAFLAAQQEAAATTPLDAPPTA